MQFAISALNDVITLRKQDVMVDARLHSLVHTSLVRTYMKLVSAAHLVTNSWQTISLGRGPAQNGVREGQEIQTVFQDLLSKLFTKQLTPSK